MFIKSFNFLKKNMAVLACVAFISVLFPEFTHAASQPSSSKSPFMKNSLSLFIPFFSSANPIFTFIPSNPAMLNILSTDDKKPVENPVNTQQDKKDKDSYKDKGNSTSTKPPNGRD